MDHIRSILEMAAQNTGVGTLVVLTENQVALLVQLVEREAVQHAIADEQIGGAANGWLRNQFRIKSGRFIDIITPPTSLA